MLVYMNLYKDSSSYQEEQSQKLGILGCFWTSEVGRFFAQRVPHDQRVLFNEIKIGAKKKKWPQGNVVKTKVLVFLVLINVV